MSGLLAIALMANACLSLEHWGRQYLLDKYQLGQIVGVSLKEIPTRNQLQMGDSSPLTSSVGKRGAAHVTYESGT